MNESTPHLSDITQTPPGAETFWHVVLRRSRYIAAIVLSAVIFLTLGWKFAAPPADFGGVSLLGWPNHAQLLSTLVLAALLIVTAILCTIIIHPDSPHMGFFCALLGMSAIAIRGGSSHMLVQFAKGHGEYGTLSSLLSLECIQLGIVILLAEIAVRELHHRFFANSRWITRMGAEAGTRKLPRMPAGGLGMNASMGISLAIRKTLKTEKFSRAISTPLAVTASVAMAFLFLYEFLQSQSTGQVMFACFGAFLFSTICAYFAFPRVSMLALILAVPITGAIGFYFGRDNVGAFPGQGGLFISRALPIFFVTAGIPGAILGYYWSFVWSLRTEEEEE